MSLGVSAGVGHSTASVAAEPITRVVMDQDGLGLTPAEVISRLSRIAESDAVEPDQYGVGDSVAAMESYFAKVLNKPYALFMPSGTLANQLALRVLAGEDRRVAVQTISHVYNDTGDACQTLSGLSLIPLGADQATFTAREVQEAQFRTATGRVRAKIGVISIETPVRRASGELFNHAEMLRICQWARGEGIRLHLDGARLFIASAYSSIAPADYAGPFDTVYVSLWKCFNCLNGAILAGIDEVMFDRLFHLRRMFGGALFHAWPFATLARHYAQGYVERLQTAIRVSETFITQVAGAKMQIERIPNGSNIFRLRVAAAKAVSLRDSLMTKAVVLPKWGTSDGQAIFQLHVNESWNGRDGGELATMFKRAAA